MRQLYNPGLQLFTDADKDEDILYKNGNVQKLSQTKNMDNGPEVDCIVDQDILLSIKQRDISLSKSVHFSDSSPTIVPESPYVSNSTYGNSISPFWNNIISLVFKDLPYSDDDQFKEEFKYNIISSSFLHDLNSYIHPLKPKSSILDLNNQENQKMNKNVKMTRKTRYGRLIKVTNYKFMLIESLDYRNIIFSCLKVIYSLRKLDKSLQHNTKRIIIVILVLLYLSFQQTHFRIRNIKTNFIKIIKQITPTFENFDALISQYHLQYKELNIKKNSIQLQEKEQIKENKHIENKSSLERTNISIIHDILNFTTNHIFFKMSSTIRQWLIHCNFDNLHSYCEIFDITVLDLCVCLTQHCTSLSQNISNIHILQKFLFCCLLSIPNDSIIQPKIHDANFKKKILRLFKCTTNENLIRNDEGSILNQVNLSLMSLIETMKILISSLKENKDAFEETRSDCTIYSIDGSHDQTMRIRQLNLIFETLESLEDQIGMLRKFHNKNKLNHNFSSIENRLQNLMDSINYSHKEQQSHMVSKGRHTSRIISEKRTSNYSKGFSLDVLRAPSPLDASINLNRKVEFIKVGNSDAEDGGLVSSDDEYFNEDETIIQCEVQPNVETHTNRGMSVHYQSMRQLSDEQLQRQLQDKITKFSAENKKSRENLRAEKSFELLKRCRNHHNEQLNFDKTKNAIHGQFDVDMTELNGKLDKEHHICVSEEGIPILYNIREYS